MASIVHETAVGERRARYRRAEDRAGGSRRWGGLSVSWGGVWSGVLLVIGMLILLTVLGLAIGVSAVDPGETEAQTFGAGAAVWAALSLLVALFVGGMVSTRFGMVYDKATGAFEGVLVWVLSILLMMYLAGTGIAMVAGGAFRLVGGATQAVTSVAKTMDADQLSTGSVDEIIQRLRDPQTAQVISSAFGMQRAEVQSNLAQIADRVEKVRDDPAAAAAEARQGVQQLFQQWQAQGGVSAAAERVQPEAAATAWIALLAMVLSLLAAIWGAMIGRRRAALRAGTETT
jgi:hypothetical protein